MKVKELIEALATFDQDADVILQKDSGGNGYSPLAGTEHDAVYVPESGWSGHVYNTKWSADDACKKEDEWAALMEQPRCVVLFPVN